EDEGQQDAIAVNKSTSTTEVIERESKEIKSFSKEEYNSRIYPRNFEPIEMRYRLVKRDPNNHNNIIYEGVEHPTVTNDISARGLRFVSKTLLPIGSILEIKIQLEEGEKSIECLAKVCRVEEDNLKNVYMIANYFLDISSADRALIGQYVERKIGKPKEEMVNDKA
ncbi:MAG: PilZ domain-containing protein, partial [Candidatus Omnitrophica bacterium]|nr:PilZ domain-containing protein [Candidatus Omnitrophota bacterium]